MEASEEKRSMDITIVRYGNELMIFGFNMRHQNWKLIEGHHNLGYRIHVMHSVPVLIGLN